MSAHTEKAFFTRGSEYLTLPSQRSTYSWGSCRATISSKRMNVGQRCWTDSSIGVTPFAFRVSQTFVNSAQVVGTFRLYFAKMSLLYQTPQYSTTSAMPYTFPLKVNASRRPWGYSALCLFHRS